MKVAILKIVTVATLTLAGGFFLVAASQVLAANIGLSVQPIKVVETLKPGESFSGAIQITNVSDGAVGVETNIKDFVPLEGSYQVRFVGRVPGITSVQDWISLDVPKSFTLEKGAEKTIGYKIKLPVDAEPGGHFGVILFKANELAPKGQSLQIGTQVGTLVLVTVPGSHLEKGEILDFAGPLFVSTSHINFIIKFKNTGTVYAAPQGKIAISNMFGKKIGEVTVNGPVVLPTATSDIGVNVNLEGVFLGRYTAALKMVDGEGNEIANRSLVFYAFPLWYIVAFLVTVVVLFFGIRFLKKNVNISVSRK